MRKLLLAAIISIAPLGTMTIHANAGQAEIEACKNAIMASGKDFGYATGFCSSSTANRHTVSEWNCIMGQMSRGKDYGYASGYCG